MKRKPTSRGTISNKKPSMKAIEGVARATLDALLLARGELQSASYIEGAVEDLKLKLAWVDKDFEENVRACPNEVGRWELGAAWLAAGFVTQFLRLHSPSKAMDRLRISLEAFAHGQRTAMFQTISTGGRTGDLPSIQSLKGILAAIMHVKQNEGMSRAEAAAWVARHTSRKLAARISRKPINARTVEEWFDRFGGKHPPDNEGGRAFKFGRRLGPKLTPNRMKELTEDMGGLFATR